MQADYVMGARIDEPLTMTRSSTTYYYNTDGLGNVRQVLNSSGTIVESYDYDPYGQVTIYNSSLTDITSSGSGIGNPYMYTGRRFDEETGIYHYRARQYDPEIGRFLQRDPLGYYDSMNAYEYVTSNPVNWIDDGGEARRKRKRRRGGSKTWDGVGHPPKKQSTGSNQNHNKKRAGGREKKDDDMPYRGKGKGQVKKPKPPKKPENQGKRNKYPKEKQPESEEQKPPEDSKSVPIPIPTDEPLVDVPNNTVPVGVPITCPVRPMPVPLLGG